jgi:Transposase DDE domain
VRVLYPAIAKIILRCMPTSDAVSSGPLSSDRVHDYLDALFGEDLHAKRVLSLSNATVGVLHGASLGIHAIGQGLAAARGLLDRHAVKQVDRLFSNASVEPWVLAERWVPHVIGSLQEVFINLDWSEFEPDDHALLVASMQTDHGRSTPLLWKTVVRSSLRKRRNDYEDELLVRLREVTPRNVKVTIVADRAFADQKLYAFLRALDFHFLIRFRSVILVTDRNGVSKKASEWLGGGRQMRVLRDASVTRDGYSVATVVCCHATGMKDAWCLASSDPTATGQRLVMHYGKRFTIEEMFRDVKDIRFGLGLSWTRVGNPQRRDRILLVAALAQGLLILLGRAGENLGVDRYLKVNTSKKRTLSLLRQGLRWYDLLPNMPAHRSVPLLAEFQRLMQLEPVYQLAMVAK